MNSQLLEEYVTWSIRNNSDLYLEYRKWLKDTLDITPEDTFMGIRAVDELKSMRDEFTGKRGDTEIVLLMKQQGTFESQLKDWDKWKILTFEEYLENRFGGLA